MLKRLATALAGLFFAASSFAQSYVRIPHQVYMTEGKTTFTCDVFKPVHPNGAAVLFLVSGGWVSGEGSINIPAAEALTSRGYTCIEVVHGSQPQYRIDHIVKMIARAVRYARANSSRFGFDGNRIGITGGSSGGHLSLYAAATGDSGHSRAKDPVERASSKVQAAAVFFPPTDFLHWTPDGRPAFVNPTLVAVFGKAFVADPKKTSSDRLNQVGKSLSPATYLTRSMPPTMIVHGDADTVVPLYQSTSFIARLDKLRVPNKLIVEHGRGHGFPEVAGDFLKMIDWFDLYLRK